MLDITPANVCQGQELHFHINARGTHTTAVTPADEKPYRSIHMGQYLIDTEDIIADDDRLNAWSHDMQYAVMTDGASMNSTDPRILFYNGLAQVTRVAREHCNFAGDDCYTVRVHPRIKKVSKNEGYITGGQSIRIDGVSFNGTNVEVMVDDVACKITDRGLDYINCVTGERAAGKSAIGYQPGQPGMTLIQTDEEYKAFSLLQSSFEVMHLNSSNPITGWFKAPATGQYRFYISCDAACSLKYAETPLDPTALLTTEPTMKVIASLKKGSSFWRDYHYQDNDGHYSEWIVLQGGQQYYFSGETKSQMSVGVEIKPDDAKPKDVTEDKTECTDPNDNSTCTTTSTVVSSLPSFTGHKLATKGLHQIAYEQTVIPEEWSI